MNGPTSQRIVPVILSGGAGTRLWPLSRRARPKQMLDLTGSGSMLMLTAERVADADLFAPPIVVAGADQAEAIEAELAGIGTLILEPAARNTAPAIALAALHAAADDVLLVLPSDHAIADAEGFRAAVRRALPFAQGGWIVTFGMKAERAETGYGYVKRGAALGEGVHAAARFVEKPDAATAETYVADGCYDWNGGIFLFRAGAMLDAMAMHAPAILKAAEAAMAGATRDSSALRPRIGVRGGQAQDRPGSGGTGARVYPEASAFRASPAQSIDYAVMEKADKVAVAPVAVGWSDIGSWDALHIASDKDKDGNVVVGPGVALGAHGCLIRSDGPAIAAIGVEDLVIVATSDAVLVVPRAQSQRVKEAVDALKAKGMDQW